MKKKVLLSLFVMVLFVITGCSISPILEGKRLIIVNGNSMYPTLKDGEKAFYRKTDEFNRFDIIFFKYENNSLIKRIYGMPGDTITINNEKIYINNKKIEDKYVYGITKDNINITLEDNEYYVLGDNREISRDSRHIGPIKKESIMGVVLKNNE